MQKKTNFSKSKEAKNIYKSIDFSKYFGKTTDFHGR